LASSKNASIFVEQTKSESFHPIFCLYFDKR